MTFGLPDDELAEGLEVPLLRAEVARLRALLREALGCCESRPVCWGYGSGRKALLPEELVGRLRSAAG